MSKSIFTLILLLFSIFTFSQDLRVVYNYKFKIDSLNRDEINEELVFLDINDDKSFFSSLPNLVYDSIFSVKFKNIDNYSDRNFTNYTNNSRVNYSVTKNLSSDEKILHENVSAIDYGVSYNDKINWTITTETKILNGTIVRKAEATYIGRNWIAWYSIDYPINDGPYLFSNLPGLILEIYDDKKDHEYIFLSILNKKDKAFYDNSKNYSQDILVSKIKFNKLWKDYIVNPAKNFLARNANSSSNVTATISVGGVSDVRQLAKLMEEELKIWLIKNNNPINLELFKR